MAGEDKRDNRSSDKDGERARAGRQMTLAAIVISFFLSLRKAAGYITDMLIAYFFGASRRTDVFYTIKNAIIFMIYTKIEKLLRPTYLPEFVAVRERHGEERAWRAASAVGLLQLTVLVVIAAVLIIFAEPIVGWWRHMTPTPADLRVAATMLRIMAVGLVFFSLSVWPELTLHAYKRFTLPAVAETCYGAGTAIFMIALIYLVWRPDNPTAIYAAAAAVAIGGTLRLLVQIPGIARWRSLIRPVAFWREPSVGRIIRLMPPIFVGLLFSSIRTIADSKFADRLGERIYTCLTFGRKLLDAPLQILPLAVSFVVYPFLSEWQTRDQREELSATLVAMTRAMAFIFVPASIVLMATARPLVQLLFGHGRFGPEDVDTAALALYCYAPAMFFLAVEGSLNKWYFAAKDTLTPNIWGVVGVLVHLAMGYVGTYVYRGSVGVIALALTVSKAFKVVVLYFILWRRLPAIDLRPLGVWLVKLLANAALLGATLWFISPPLRAAVDAWQPPFGGAKVRAAAFFAAVCTIAAIQYLALAAALRFEELTAVLRQARRRSS